MAIYGEPQLFGCLEFSRCYRESAVRTKALGGNACQIGRLAANKRASLTLRRLNAGCSFDGRSVEGPLS